VAVLIDERRASARVETSWLDGLPRPGAQRLYRLQGTLLERVLADETPLYVQAMAERASANPAYELLRHLVALGMRDAIFLPLTPQTQTPIPADRLARLTEPFFSTKASGTGLGWRSSRGWSSSMAGAFRCSRRPNRVPA